MCPQDAGSSVSPDVPLDTQAIVEMIAPAGGELAGSSDTVREPGRTERRCIEQRVEYCRFYKAL